VSALVLTARSMASSLQHAVYNPAFYEVMEKLIEDKLYLSYFDNLHKAKVEFGSFLEFTRSPDGLAVTDYKVFVQCLGAATRSANGEVATKATRLLAMIQPLADHGGARAEQADFVSLPTHGNSQSYLLRRLQRDRPELVEQIGKGKRFRSARAAAIEAGIVKATPTVALGDPAKAAAAVVRHQGEEWATSFLLELADLLKYHP
jgi:hypothetical protein